MAPSRAAKELHWLQTRKMRSIKCDPLEQGNTAVREPSQNSNASLPSSESGILAPIMAWRCGFVNFPSSLVRFLNKGVWFLNKDLLASRSHPCGPHMELSPNQQSSLPLISPLQMVSASTKEERETPRLSTHQKAKSWLLLHGPLHSQQGQSICYFTSTLNTE